MAARVRKELKTDVEMIHGPYGRFEVLADGVVIVDGGALAALGVLPPVAKVLEAVRIRLAAPPPA